jgi:hypothetical protein
MKIREFLNDVGISEVTYHALRRNEAISFMPRKQKGKEEGFPLEQLLALKTFALLRAYGLNSRTAAETVQAAFPAMQTIAGGGQLASDESYKLGVRLVASGGKVALHQLRTLPPKGSIEVGRIELDLRGISSLLPDSKRFT